MSTSFKALLRSLNKYRLFTALNVIGLAIGISSCWIIYNMVSYEFSFEQKLPKRDQCYRLVTGFIFDEKESYNGGVSAPIYQAVREEVRGLERAVPLFGQWINTVRIEQPGKTPVELEEPQGVVATDSSYFEMVPYVWLAGNAGSAFVAPENVVLTESRARKYFGNLPATQLIGRTFFYNDSIQKTISGIVKDLDYPTEFTAQEFTVLIPKAYELNTWTNTNGSDKLYLQIRNGADTSKILTQISTLVHRKLDEFAQLKRPGFKMKRWFELLPLSESHFSTYIKEYQIRKASKPVLYGLIGLGAFLLVLACINYVNLSTALVPQRSKEIGVRKVLGSSRRALMTQVLSETFVTVLLALILAFLFTRLGYILLKDILPDGVTKHAYGWELFLFLLPVLCGTTLLAGWYPAWLIAKVKPASIIRGQGGWKIGNNRFVLRKVLIVFQFLIAQVFIIIALIVSAQIQYSLKKDMGFDKEAVVLIDIPWKLQRNKLYDEKQFILATELRQETGISRVSLGRKPMTPNYSSTLYEYSTGDASKEPIKRQVFRKSVDTAYIPLYGLELLAGRNLMQSDTTREYVINETALHAFGFNTPEEAIGKFIGRPGNKLPIVGVVKDFHLQDFHNSIDPVALMMDRKDMGTLNIKLNTTDPGKWQQTIKNIEQKWNALYPPGNFEIKFYDQELESMYKQERELSKLINMATAIAILISCLGLFGLAIITAFQRTKEIGIRKVLGASVPGIVRILSSDFVKLVVIALLIATPISWVAMNRWLQDFAYRIEIKWWVFALAGLGAVVIAILTVSFHAIKAAVANPINSLRNE